MHRMGDKRLEQGELLHFSKQPVEPRVEFLVPISLRRGILKSNETVVQGGAYEWRKMSALEPEQEAAEAARVEGMQAQAAEEMDHLFFVVFDNRIAKFYDQATMRPVHRLMIDQSKYDFLNRVAEDADVLIEAQEAKADRCKSPAKTVNVSGKKGAALRNTAVTFAQSGEVQLTSCTEETERPPG